MSLYSNVFDLALRAEKEPVRLFGELNIAGIPPVPQPIDWWRRRPGAPQPVDLEVLDWVTGGRVLDLGCCTGRHLEILAERGVRGHGIDVTPAAISLARAAGVSCSLADADRYEPPHPVDAVLMLGGNGGMAGLLEALPKFLSRVASWLKPDGAIIFTSSDFRPILPAGGDAGGTPDGHWGDRMLRHRLDEHVGPWFPWLFLDLSTLADVCAEVGLRIERQREWPGRGTANAALLKRC